MCDMSWYSLKTRFAPHLEKCMGMGRNSSRVASRRLATKESSYRCASEETVCWQSVSYINYLLAFGSELKYRTIGVTLGFSLKCYLGRVAMRRRRTMMTSGWNRASVETEGGGTGILPGGADWPQDFLQLFILLRSYTMCCQWRWTGQYVLVPAVLPK